MRATNRGQSYVGGNLQSGLLGKLARFWLAYNFALWFGMFLLDVYVFHITPAKGGGAELLWNHYGEFCRRNVHLLICVLVLSPFLFWNVLWLTHRVAGPLERFRTALERLQRGEPVKPLTTRRDDLLVEYQYAFNRYLATLEPNREPWSPTRQLEDEADGESIENPLLKDLGDIQAEIRQIDKPSYSP